MQLLSNLTLACENSRFQAFGISKRSLSVDCFPIFFLNFPLKMQYIRRLNTKPLPKDRSEETTPNLLGKEIEIKVVLKAEPVSQ